MVTYKEFWEMSHQDRVKLFKGKSTSMILMYMMNIIDSAEHFSEMQKAKGKNLIMERYKELSKIKDPYLRAQAAFNAMIESQNKLAEGFQSMARSFNTSKPNLKVVKAGK